MKLMPDLRPRPAVPTEKELAARCARSLQVREIMKLEKDNAKLVLANQASDIAHNLADQAKEDNSK